MRFNKTKMRQLVDWGAALRAGVYSGLIFLALNLLLTHLYVGSPWVVVRLVASVVMGKGVLPPPATFDVTIFLVALVVHLVLSIGFACLIAYVLHRWGLIVGILGGAVLGLALYAINFYTISFFFPWFFPMRSWIMALSHALFGACAGGFYEAMEVEKFVPAES
ncbi:hypothetical protein HUU39_13880 [candidate division KSB1 bacterium]|nr:hypothetical protein [bacterium]NUM66355.1 hypothetical protein [candidate division KSB1 bacterium]